MCRVRSRDRTCEHRRSPSDAERFAATISRSKLCSVEIDQRDLWIGLDVSLVLLRKRSHEARRRPRMIVNHQNAARLIRKHRLHGIFVRDAHLAAGRSAHQHLVVQHLETSEALNARDEGDIVDGFGEEIVGAAFEALDPVGWLIERRDHDDRNVQRLGLRL